MTRLAKLQITDGTTTYDLLETTGFSLKEWRPARAPLKGDGSWSSSPMSDGRALVAARLDNAVETFSFVAAHYGQDTLTAWMQDLERLLLKGREYWTSRWQGTPVYIEARGQQETNTRYAILYNYALSGDGDPYQQPFFAIMGRTAHDEMTLILERRHWLSAPPTTDLCTKTQAGEVYKNHFRGRLKSEFVGGAYMDVCTPESAPYQLLQETGGTDYILQEDGISPLLQDAFATNYAQADECYVTNHHINLNFSDIYAFDASAGTFGLNLVLANPPFRFFTNPAGNGDMAYFGISTTSENVAPFNNIVFHLSSPWTFAAGESVAWEYWNGAGWLGPIVTQDNTSGGTDLTHSFQVAGCVSVTFAPPASWAATVINGVNAYWVRCVLTAVGAKTPPAQTSRYIYTATWPFVEIGEGYGLTGDTTDVRGDLPALGRALIHNQSGYDVNNPLTLNAGYFDRCLIGLRSLWRGSDFTPYLNLNDLYGGMTGPGQLKDAQVFLDAAESTWLDTNTAPSGRCIRYFAQTLNTLNTQFHVVLGAQSAAHYRGRFRCFIRATTSNSDLWMSLRVSSGAIDSPLYYETPLLNVSDAAAYGLNDFGIITLPVSGEDNTGALQSIYLAVKIRCNSVLAYSELWLYDIILMPIDEWFGDFSENVNGAPLVTIPSSVLHVLDVDSTRNPRRSLMSSLRGFQDDMVQTIYPPLVAGPMILQANQPQRLWFLLANYTIGWDSFSASPFVTASVRVRKVEQYTGMRGAR